MERSENAVPKKILAHITCNHIDLNSLLNNQVQNRFLPSSDQETDDTSKNKIVQFSKFIDPNINFNIAFHEHDLEKYMRARNLINKNDRVSLISVEGLPIKSKFESSPPESLNSENDDSARNKHNFTSSQPRSPIKLGLNVQSDKTISTPLEYNSALKAMNVHKIQQGIFSDFAHDVVTATSNILGMFGRKKAITKAVSSSKTCSSSKEKEENIEENVFTTKVFCYDPKESTNQSSSSQRLSNEVPLLIDQPYKNATGHCFVSRDPNCRSPLYTETQEGFEARRKRQQCGGAPDARRSEQEFVEARLSSAKKAILDFVGLRLEDVNEDNIPIISSCFSGGGIFAFIYALGNVQAMVESNMEDMFTYYGGVSGGAWFLSCWLSFEGSINEFVHFFFNKMQTFKQSNLVVNYFTNNVDNLIYLYGQMLRHFLPYPDMTLSGMINSLVDKNPSITRKPYPILTTARRLDAIKSCEIFEHTPHYVYATDSNVGVGTPFFGRKFSEGSSVDTCPEFLLCTVMGVIGSAFTATVSDLNRWNVSPSLSEFFSSLGIRESGFFEPIAFYNFAYKFSGLRLITDLPRSVPFMINSDIAGYRQLDIPPQEAKSKSKAVEVESVCDKPEEEPSTNNAQLDLNCSKELKLVDAGIYLNAPIPSMLNRGSNIVLVFDATMEAYIKSKQKNVKLLGQLRQYFFDHSQSPSRIPKSILDGKWELCQFCLINVFCDVDVPTKDSPAIVYIPFIKSVQNNFDPINSYNIFEFSYSETAFTNLVQCARTNFLSEVSILRELVRLTCLGKGIHHLIPCKCRCIGSEKLREVPTAPFDPSFSDTESKYNPQFLASELRSQAKVQEHAKSENLPTSQAKIVMTAVKY